MSSSSSSGLSKRELVELLECAKNSKERNKAVKLLKKYEPVKNFEWDAYGKKENLTHKRYEYVKAFLCPRCGVVKQTKPSHYKKFLKKNYRLLSSNVIPFGYKTFDGFHSELFLFKKK